MVEKSAQYTVPLLNIYFPHCDIYPTYLDRCCIDLFLHVKVLHQHDFVLLFLVRHYSIRVLF